MRLLLDTHILMALVEDRPGFLPKRRRELIDANPCFVSVASLWEIAIKHRLGKLPLGLPLETLPDVVAAMNFEIIDIAAAHALASLDPEPPTRDPFDRLLLAQCKIEGLRLVSVDRALVGHPYAVTE